MWLSWFPWTLWLLSPLIVVSLVTGNLADGAAALTYLLPMALCHFLWRPWVKKTRLQGCRHTDGPSSALSRHLAADLLILFRVWGVCGLLIVLLIWEVVKKPVTERWIRAVSSHLWLEEMIQNPKRGNLGPCLRVVNGLPQTSKTNF